MEDRALSPEYEIVVQIDKDNHTDEVLSVIVNRGIKHWFYSLNKDFAKAAAAKKDGKQNMGTELLIMNY